LHINTFQTFCLLFLSIFAIEGIGQSRPNLNTLPSGVQQTSSSGPNSQSYVPDTTIVNSFQLGDREKLLPFSDTLIDDQEKYLISRTFRKSSLTLGNHGSAAFPIIYQSQRDIFTDIGFKQYDIYKLSLDSLKFYKLNRPFNDLFFSPFGGSENFVVKGTFAREFDKNLNITLDLDRINQEGFYDGQDTKATSFGLGIWQDRKDKNHQWYLSFLVNNFNESHNGGTPFDLNTDTTYSSNTYRLDRGAVPNFLPDASVGRTRHQQFSYAVDNFFTNKTGKYKIHHRIQFENGYYRFGDDDTEDLGDSLVYLQYLTSERGLRTIHKFSRWTNQVDVGFETKGFNVELGLVYKNLSVNDDVTRSNYNDLALYSKLDFQLRELTRLTGKLYLGLGNNSGNLDLDTRLNVAPIRGLNIQGKLKILRYDPTLISQRFVITEQEVFNNEFGKTNEFIIGGALNLRKLKLQAEVESGIIDNPVYYNSMAMPTQLDGSTEYLKAIVTHKFFWRFIGLDNSFVYQSFTNNIYGYLQFKFFKKRLLGRVGILLYHTEHDGHVRFMPVNGAFFPGENTTEYNPYSELYSTFQIERFYIFFKMENYTDALFRKVQYQVVNYPQFDARFRMGVRWQIFD